MDVLELTLEKATYDYTDVVEDQLISFINGKSLLSMVRDIELPFANAENNSELAGSYLGLDPIEVRNLKDHFLGRVTPDLEFGEKLPILRCVCGLIGCWPLITRITVTNDQVIWSDFEQPHRSEWNYTGLRSLAFDRRQYEAEFDRILKQIEP